MQQLRGCAQDLSGIKRKETGRGDPGACGQGLGPPNHDAGCSGSLVGWRGSMSRLLQAVCSSHAQRKVQGLLPPCWVASPEHKEHPSCSVSP